MAARQQLAILGSGWGAFQLLKHVDPAKFAVTLISPRNHMLFTPLLSAASVGTVGPRHICEPVKPVCKDKGARFCEAHAEGIDTKQQVVQCRSLQGEAYDVHYDHLVLAVGKRANDFGIPGVKKHALFMKETKDATRLREALLARLEEAACVWNRVTTFGSLDSLNYEEDGCELSECGKQRVRQLLSIVVVGGGPQSVGLAEELLDFVSRDVTRYYPALAPLVSVHLVEWASRNACPWSQPPKHMGDQLLRDYALSRLSRRSGVQLHLGEPVQEASATELRLQSGKTLPCGVLVWNAGTKPVPLVRDLDLSKTPDGSRLLIDPQLRVQGQTAISAIGDCAQLKGAWLPQNAQIAKQQATYIANALNDQASSASSSSSPAFAPSGLTGLVYSGGRAAEALGGVGASMVPRALAGRLAWLAWRSASWSSQLSMKNRLSVTTDRMLSYSYGRSLTRFGQDTTELPVGNPRTSKTTSEASIKPAWPKFDEELTGLLGDLGMRPTGHMSRMPPILNNPNLPKQGQP